MCGYKLLHVSAPTCHNQKVITTKVYKPTCRYTFCYFSQTQLKHLIFKINKTDSNDDVNEELSDLYALPIIVRVVKLRRMRWVGHVAHMGEGRGVHRVLVGKPEGKRPLGRRRCRWEDNIKMDLQEVGGGCGGWMELVQDRERWRALVR